MTSSDPIDQEKDACRIEVDETSRYRQQIPGIVASLVRSCDTEECFDHVGPEPISSRESIIRILSIGRLLLFPGYFIPERLDRINLEYYLGQEAVTFFEALSEQITLAVRHDCIRYDRPCSKCRERGQAVAIAFMKELPSLRRTLAKDIRAAHEGDPAAGSFDEIIFSYPGVFAISVYRIAHQLFHLNVPLIPRIMTEYAHSKTGIDIHPAAHIGERFFIDHGTGVVIGATAEIGDNVRIYQGVTLGALSLPKDAMDELRNRKRHPTIENDVVIYAGATILGGETVIGARSVIGGNVWITEPVPPDTRVFLKRPELVVKDRGLHEVHETST
ncbi:MAG: serine O-acetyltransferase EpsC [Desulfatiglandaceae bacterium]